MSLSWNQPKCMSGANLDPCSLSDVNSWYLNFQYSLFYYTSDECVTSHLSVFYFLNKSTSQNNSLPVMIYKTHKEIGTFNFSFHIS